MIPNEIWDVLKKFFSKKSVIILITIASLIIAIVSMIFLTQQKEEPSWKQKVIEV